MANKRYGEDELRKRLVEESHAVDVLFRSLPTQLRRSIQRGIAYKINILVEIGNIIPVIDRETGEVNYKPTIKTYEELSKLPEEQFREMAEEAEKIGMLELAQLVKKEELTHQDTRSFVRSTIYMNEKCILEPLTIFRLRDRGEITAEEEKILLERYETYEQEQENRRKLIKQS